MPNAIIDVCAAVVCRDGRYLLAKRHADKHMGGKWEFPGGKIHDGESCADCIVREMEEELAVTVTHPRLMAVTEFAYPEKTIRLHFMRCELEPDVRHDRREHQEAGWFAPGKILELDLAPADREFAERLAGALS